MSGLFLVKVVVSALVIALASELAKRDSFWGALLVALPLTSMGKVDKAALRATWDGSPDK